MNEDTANDDMANDDTVNDGMTERDSLLVGYPTGPVAQAIVETMREAVLVLDGELRVESANDAFLQTFLVRRDDTIGTYLYDLGNRQWDVPTLRRLLEELLPERQELRDYELEHDFPGVGRKVMRLNARRLRHGHDAPEGGGEASARILLVIQDVTERSDLERRLEAHARELERSNAELERFAYVASHDLQEPLRTVSSFTQLLERRLAGSLDDTSRGYMGFVVDGARRMQSLVDDLLAYSRIGRGDPNLAPVDLGAVVERVLASLARPLQDAGGTVSVGSLPTVVGDAPKLEMAFANLLGNAVKFRSARPLHVEVTAELAGDAWTIHVRDNGIGMDERYFERIFVIFQRLHTQSAYPGTGIGLAMVKRIVELHGGRIAVASTVGEGSVFRVTLPERGPDLGSPEGRMDA